MKYVVIIGDGMADRPIDEIGGLTVLQKAVTPNMDRLAVKGTVGMVRTIPAGMTPGSDVANLSARRSRSGSAITRATCTSER